jgi:hypothetical protein
MTFLNQITNPEKLIETKVNFFADYYNFVASQIQESDNLEIENYLSLIEKMVFQINTNLNNCSKYIDSYLTHPLIQKENSYFKEYKNYSLVSNLFEEYKRNTKPNRKTRWISDNPNFKLALIRFSIELKKVMFKKSLKEIISLLKCIHNIAEHKNDFIHHTNILVSEFLLSNKAKEDVIKTFNKIITRDINIFPFSTTFLRKNKNNLLQAKKEFLETRTFDQQFEGIFHYLKEKKRNEYFIFRIYNIKANKSFKFKYNEVTFYHPEHRKFDEFSKQIKEIPFSAKFFSEKDMILAIIKIQNSSKKISEQIAINTIKKELEYLEFSCTSNSLFEYHSYLSTLNFKDLSSKWSQKENSHTISERNEISLKMNPFILLKNVNKQCKEHFLNYEYLFVKAQVSRTPEDYWHYFETLLKVISENTTNLINTIASILVLSSHQCEKSLIENYIVNSIVNSNESQLNLSQSEFKILRNSKKQNLLLKAKDVTHPFINHLFERKNINPNYRELKAFYSRIFWDCYSQRNSVIHSFQRNEKALLSIDTKLTNLVLRFRNTLIESMIENKEMTFNEQIDLLTIN